MKSEAFDLKSTAAWQSTEMVAIKRAQSNQTAIVISGVQA